MKRLLFILLAFTLAPLAYAQVGDKHDTKLPVEISSDTLEVLQHENKAIFKGNVVAVQGDMRLKSDTMIVHYKQKDQSSPAAPKPVQPATPASAQGEMGAITLIEVIGNVLAATPEESATGDKGDYNVPTKMLHLFGSNVTLTRDKNILKGTALEYNLATGRSVLSNNGAVMNSAGGVASGGRVRGVFVPSEDKPNEDKPGEDKSSEDKK